MRVSKEINELENRIAQNIAFATQKLENKLQAFEKSVQSDRVDALATLKSEFGDDLERVEQKLAKKADLASIQTVQAQLKEDLVQVQNFFERQDRRLQELKQTTAQTKDEVGETRQELTKALHSQQTRVSTILEEKVAQLNLMSKEKNAKLEQKLAIVEKKAKKIEENSRSLQEKLEKIHEEYAQKYAATAALQHQDKERLRSSLAKALAELEQLSTQKIEAERQAERQERQLQIKLKEMKHKVEELEQHRESQRAEIVKQLEVGVKQLGVAEGKNAMLEAMLAKEKVTAEERNQQLLKSRQEMTLIRQKMRVLEAEVEKKMAKLNSELVSKHAQVDSLLRKVKRSEEELARADEASKRELKVLRKAKALKMQELNLARLRLKEAEKAAASLAHEAALTASKTEAQPLSDLQSKQRELEEMLAERVTELEAAKRNIERLTKEFENAKTEHQQLMEKTTTEYSTRYEATLAELQLQLNRKEC
ncbi:hypothetical protein PINS_up004866 [Pythium insidiosum]|nr:hypothetical protein PINS_up004866 [Pythium insidiosum]